MKHLEGGDVFLSRTITHASHVAMPVIDHVERAILAVVRASGPQVTLMHRNEGGAAIPVAVATPTLVPQLTDERESHSARGRRHADETLRETAGGAAVAIEESDDVPDGQEAAGSPEFIPVDDRTRTSGSQHTVIAETLGLAQVQFAVLAQHLERLHSGRVSKEREPLPRGADCKRVDHVPTRESANAVGELMLALRRPAI